MPEPLQTRLETTLGGRCRLERDDPRYQDLKRRVLATTFPS